MMDWTDATSYSRGERGNRDPDSWEITLHGSRVYITKGHIYYRQKWALICRDIQSEPMLLADEGTPLDLVKIAALATVEGRMRAKIARMELAADAMHQARIEVKPPTQEPMT